jgi:glyoxylate utilization-related uncharacterized protein
MMKKIFFAFLLIPFLSCTKNNIVGQWQGESATVNGAEINANFANILMELGENGAYQYKATDNYIERGMYRVDGKFFITIDTLNKKLDKMVEIEQLTTDRLVLKMKNLRNEIELLTLKKITK